MLQIVGVSECVTFVQAISLAQPIVFNPAPAFLAARGKPLVACFARSFYSEEKETARSLRLVMNPQGVPIQVKAFEQYFPFPGPSPRPATENSR